MIITMVYCHVQVEYDGFGIYNYWSKFFHFFMPWFFFKSGMFHKPDQNLQQSVQRCYTRLIIPFGIFSLLGTCVASVLYFLQHNLHINFLWSPFKYLWQGGFILGNEPLWFLLSLAATKIIVSAIAKNRRSMIVVSVLGIILAYILFLSKANTPLWIANISAGLFFYICGYLLKDFQYKYNFLLALSFLIFIIVAIIYPSNYVAVYNVAVGSFPLAILTSLAGCVLINSLFRRFNFNIAFLSYIGKNSMVYLVLHMIIINIVKIFSEVFSFGVAVSFYINVVLIIISFPFLVSFFNNISRKWMIGLA